MDTKKIVLLILLPLAACAATTGKQCTPPAPSASNAAEVIIYRPPVGYLFSQPISIDDCIIGEIAEGEFIRYKVVAAKHRIGSEVPAGADMRRSEISSDFKGGTTSYIRFWLAKEKYRGYLFAPLYSWVGKFEVVDKAVAEQELPKLARARE